MNRELYIKKLSAKDLSPVIKYSYFFCPDPNTYHRKILEYRNINYYEIELITESEGAMIIDDIRYNIKKNDIIFRKPGQTTQGILPYKCYAIIFSLINDEFNDKIEYTNEIIDSIPLVYNTKYPSRFIPFFETIIKEHINPSTAADILFKINILQILYLIFIENSSPYINNSVVNSGIRSTLKKALDYININWQKSFSIDDLANYSGLSKNHFIKVFASAIGKTPNNYLTDYRIQKSKEMLAMTHSTIIEIALKCGYENVPYFNFVFKKKTGMTPSEFRKIHTYM